jgi:hypothetical protein
MPDQGFKMGDAFVEVHVDVDKAVKAAAERLRVQGKRELGKAADEVGGHAGKKMGDSLGSNAANGLKTQLTSAAPGIGKQTGDSLGKTLGEAVSNKATDALKGSLKTAVDEASKDLTVTTGKSTKRKTPAATIADAVEVPVTVNGDKIAAQVTKAKPKVIAAAKAMGGGSGRRGRRGARQETRQGRRHRR